MEGLWHRLSEKNIISSDRPHPILVLFLNSNVISFGRKLYPIHGTEKMETSVTEKKSNLIKLKVCDKDLRKKTWFPPRVPILHGLFSEIQCDKFLSQITPHALVTVPWPWSPLVLRSGSWCKQNQTKEVESRSTSLERTKCLVQEINQP